MDKERKSKKKRKVDKQKSSKITDDESVYGVHVYDFDGVKTVTLSPITQRAIGCIVGEHVTTEEPWMFIKKEKIEDNLDLHEESSEFLPLKQYILEYPEEEILIGYDRPLNDGQERFLLCSNVTAKDIVLNVLEEQKLELQEKLKNSVIKTSRMWTSMGSETEVNENMSNNFRSLFEVEVTTKYPLFTEKIKFSMRLAEEAKDGYVELLPGRFPVAQLSRKRIDAAVQIASKTVSNEAQTNPAYPKNMFSQYCYEYTEPHLNADDVKNLENFMTYRTNDLFDSIQENESINLYKNDYEQMAVHVIPSYLMVSRDIISFRDVLACKDKMVSDFTLDPLTSGLLAASYSRAPANHIYTSKPTVDQVNETTFGKNLVLIWCYSDVLKPKLYLHSFREVVTLSYCPFKKNIIVGGCSNGQIVIWDLTNKLEQVETREILTSDEQKHRIIINSMMRWMKVTEDIRIVMPTAVSHLDYSHTDVVSKISWILPHYVVTKNGKIVQLKETKEKAGEETENEEKERDTEEQESMQFVSCGIDGKILFWDMKQKFQGTDIRIAQKKSQRLEKRPSELLLDISEYRNLNNTLIPHFKLTVDNTKTKLPHPMTEMIIENSNLCYEAINPETKEDILKRTYFEYVKSTQPHELTNNITVCTKLGSFLKCTWEGHEFDQGQKINYEPCSVTEFLCVHDGPIRVCTSNPVEQKCALTVGGRVFAIWDTTKPEIPLFWRKSKLRYVSGFWSYTHPCSVIVVRSDAHFETWELLQRTKTPVRIIRCPGNQILDLNSESSKIHVKKNTFATSDVVGAVRIYKIPSSVEMTEDNIRQAFKIRERIEHRKRVQEEWLKSWKEKYGIESVEEPEEKEERMDLKSFTESQSMKRISLRKKSETFDKLTSNKWHEKQEQLMYEILLQKKKLNLAEIEQHKIPLQKLIEEKRSKDLKVEKILKHKEKIFDNSKKVLFKQTKIKKRKVIEITFPSEIVNTMKETYIDEYKNMETDMLKHIKLKQFRYIFDWSSMIADGRRRRNSINLHMNRVNFHNLRHKATKEYSDTNENNRLSVTVENTQSATDISRQASDEKL